MLSKHTRSSLIVKLHLPNVYSESMEHWILQMEEVLKVVQNSKFVSSSTLEYDGRNLLASISISLFPVAPLFAGAVLQY